MQDKSNAKSTEGNESPMTTKSVEKELNTAPPIITTQSKAQHVTEPGNTKQAEKPTETTTTALSKNDEPIELPIIPIQ